MVTRDKSSKGEEIWAARALWLFRLLVKQNTEDAGLEFAQYQKCVPSLDAVDEVPGCVCPEGDSGEWKELK